MSNYLTAIDFGSTKIAVVTAIKKDDNLEIVSFRETPAQGWIKNGEIFNPTKITEAIKPLIAEAEKEIGEKITEAVINVSGKFIRCEDLVKSFKRSNPQRPITVEELNSYSAQTAPKNMEEGEMVFDVIPQKFDIDDIIGQLKDEVAGMDGENIEATFTIVIGRQRLLERRIRVLQDCGINLKDAILSPIASARAVLKEAEIVNGVALVDIGGGTTEITIIKEGIVRSVSVIPFGGESVTNDIKQVCELSAKWAEVVKTKYGTCLEEDAPENKKLILKSDNGDIDNEVKLSKLASVIEARITEIFEAVQYIIEESGYGNSIPSGVVLTGGTAYMESIAHLAKSILKRRVRLAAPRDFVLDCSREKSFDAFSSTAVGLLFEGFDKKLSSITHSATLVREENYIGEEEQGDFETNLNDLWGTKPEEESAGTSKRRGNESEKSEKSEKKKREKKKGNGGGLWSGFFGSSSDNENEDLA